jgi:hypothetical protein
MGPSDLQTLPGVGPAIARDLRALGVREVKDLRGKNPEKLYQKMERQQGRHIDRCVLYTFRCAIYFAENPNAKRDRNWWHFSDKN